MNEQPELKGRGLGLVALIVGFPILILSGLCTGTFTIDTLGSGSPDVYGPSSVFEVLLIGAFGYVPAGMLVWAGFRARKRGTNTLSIILMSLVGLYILGIIIFFATLV